MQDTSEHTRSYYAATANWQTDYPVLAGEHRCDVAVVGAGFTGVSAALHLAERGYDVAVIEANRIGWGASGRNGGQLIDGIVEVEKINEIGKTMPMTERFISLMYSRRFASGASGGGRSGIGMRGSYWRTHPDNPGRRER